ncbi:sulfatase family protein [Novipirellula aureliae]|nr:arylsulfatase [Novipirellula aureliae]
MALTLTTAQAEKPNIVFVLCDDLGYGDIHCLNPERGKIPTPGVDRLAKEGMVFTDAHSGSSVCTPTRYGLMTGRYSWRTRLQSGVVQGFAPCLIAPDRPTVASFLKEQGYQTAIIGKWHLNFQYQDPQSSETLTRKGNRGGLPPVGSKIPDGPLAHGFDFYHGFHHAGDMKAVIENDEVILHEDEINMLPRLTREAVGYIDERAKTPGTPFFLYVPFGSPHSPIVPTKEWQGRSGLGKYGDFVMQTDDGFAQILSALDRNGLTENTLVVFSTDNGCSKAAGIPALQKQGHFPSADFRGSKADIWDGGHHVPFVVRWPGKVAAGSTCDQTLCLTDLFATCAELTEQPLPAGAAEDSVSFLPALKGEPIVSTRSGVIHHSISGHFAYRMGKWKLCLAKASGGWTAPKEKHAPEGSPVAQLYDMEADPGETNNLYTAHPEVAQRLLKQMEMDIERGRSTAGTDLKNDVDNIILWKSGK